MVMGKITNSHSAFHRGEDMVLLPHICPYHSLKCLCHPKTSNSTGNRQLHLSNRTSCWWFTWQYSISSRGFMSVNSARVQRPGMGPTQPSIPTQPAQVQAAITPASPPPTAQTVDTSNVPAQQRPVIMTLTRLFNETSEALGGSRANPAKKREIEDNSRKIGALFAKLNSGNISKIASEKLVQLCLSFSNGDFGTACQIQVQLTTSDWDNQDSAKCEMNWNGKFHPALKLEFETHRLWFSPGALIPLHIQELAFSVTLQQAYGSNFLVF